MLIEIYAPTNRLAEEWRDLILLFNPAKKVHVIRGRSATRPVKFQGSNVLQNLAYCQKHLLAEHLSSIGVAVYPNLCKRSQGPGRAPLKCEFHTYCDYLGQFEAAEVYIYTHAHLALERGELETWVPAEVIIDESFFQGLLRQDKLPIALLTDPRLPLSAQRLCADVSAALIAGTSLQARFATAATRKGDLKSALNALKAMKPGNLSPGDTNAKVKASLANHVNFESVRTLLSHLARVLPANAMPQSIVYDASTGQVVTHQRRAITRFNRADGTQPSITILDASASKALISQIFEIAKWVDMSVRRRAHVIQCHSTRCSTTSLVPAKNANPASAAAAVGRLIDIEKLVARLATNGKKVLVVGPMAVVGNPMGRAPLFAIPAHCEFAHFNAVRGVDHWKDFDTALIIGRNEPPVAAVEDMARAMFCDDPQPLNLTGTWQYLPRGYRLAGQRRGVDVAVHADPRVQAVAEQLRECESVQAIDRLRLIHNIAIKNVILLSSLPLDLDIDETRTWDELVHGTRLEQAWDACSGDVLPLNPAWLAAKFPQLWSTTEAAKLDVRRAIKKGQVSNMTSIGNLTPFEFKVAGQRQWSKALSALNNAGHVTIALKNLLGHDATVRLAKARP